MSSAPAATVVVGFDGSSASREALRFAFEQGAARGMQVVVVTTWMPDFPAPLTLAAAAQRDQADAAQRLQDSAIEAVVATMTRPPGYTQLILNDVSGPALVDAARTASLLVVGTRRKGALARTFLGSVSEFCIRHSPVPVVVVPDPSEHGSSEHGGDQPDAGVAQSSTVPVPSR